MILPWDEQGRVDWSAEPRHVHDPEYCIVVAAEAGEILGFAAGRRRETTLTSLRFGYVKRINGGEWERSSWLRSRIGLAGLVAGR